MEEVVLNDDTYNRYKSFFDNEIRRKIDDESVNGYDMQKCISEMKNKNTRIGLVCSNLVKTGLDLGKRDKVLANMVRGMKSLAKTYGWKRDDTPYLRFRVEEIMEKISKDEEMIKKTDSLNQLSNDFPDGQKEGIAKDLAQLVYIMEKNIRGELGQKDATILEKNMSKWQEQILALRECFEKIP